MKRLMWMLAVGFLAMPLAAQEGLPGGKWWKRPEVVRQLQLTSQQQDQLEGVFRRHAEALIDLRAEREKAHLALGAELDRPSLDRQAIQSAAGRVSQAGSRLFERELMMLVDMRGVLTSEQWNRFRAAQDRRGGQERPQRRPNAVRPRPNQ
jgi:Spy/CpxP family protein refolding chaperone